LPGPTGFRCTLDKKGISRIVSTIRDFFWLAAGARMIRYLILALTTRCQLQCRYCYNGSPASIEDMTSEVLQKAIAIAAGHDHGFHLQLTGGEPTLVPELIAQAVDLAWRTGRCRSIGIQTNGIELPPPLLELFKAHRFQVGVSVDGPPAVQQQQRGMAAETFRGLGILESAGIPFRITTVVTQVNAAMLDQLVLSVAGFSQARGIGLDLLVRKGRSRNASTVLPAETQALKAGLQKMVETLDAVNAHRQTPIRLRESDLVSNTGSNSSAFCHACLIQSMAVNPMGELFPCGQTMGDPRYAAGTVWKPTLDTLGSLSNCSPRNAQCDGCGLHGYCPGDCPSRLYYNRNENPGLVCHLYQTLLKTRPNDRL
jgi:uncharacterized protein